MVAAATLGLPERAAAGRNYDYRYVWLRDQAYAGMAAGVDEPYPLLDEAVACTTARVLEYGDRLAPAYTVDGKPLPEETTLDLSGYLGGADVIANWVTGQFQLDSYGEMLQLYATVALHDHLQSDDQQAIKVLLDLIKRRWNEPDAGIWELDNAWWTHSRLACVAGLRSTAMVRQEPSRTGSISWPTPSWMKGVAAVLARIRCGSKLLTGRASMLRCCYRPPAALSPPSTHQGRDLDFRSEEIFLGLGQLLLSTNDCGRMKDVPMSSCVRVAGRISPGGLG